MRPAKLIYTALFSLGLTASAYAGIEQRPDVQAFIQEMHQKHQFNEKELSRLFEQVTIRDDIIKAMDRPAESKPWYQYEPIFLTDQRVKKGVDFWKKYEKELARAEQEYGVPANVIVAIIGVETYYGKQKGRFSVLDSLSTLAFEYPRRADFFRKELEAFLLLSREEKIDGNSQKSSYAGAMGYPQFISSSYRHYAVDFSGDGKRDLVNNPVDAIGSVANYFRKHGWQTGEAVAIPAKVKGEAYKSQTINKLVKPSVAVKDWNQKGLEPLAQLKDETKVMPYSFELKDGQEELWLGLKNFYVITRYNRSPLYALAVHHLSERIAQEKQG